MAIFNAVPIDHEVVDWSITGLSQPFISSQYIRVGVVNTQVINGSSSISGTVFHSVYAPASGTSTSVYSSFVNSFIRGDTINIYGFAQAANGLYYQINSYAVAITMAPGPFSLSSPPVKSTPFDMDATDWHNLIDYVQDTWVFNGFSKVPMDDYPPQSGGTPRSQNYRQMANIVEILLDYPLDILPVPTAGTAIKASDINTLISEYNKIY